MRGKLALQLAAAGRFISGVDMTNRNASLKDARDVLSVHEVQQILGIGRNATYELIASGRLPSVRVTARRIVVTKKALEAFLGLPPNSPSELR
ncbi:MAG: helix-turn-helix domain-containing protein [Candidatus Cybelea sp.]